MKTSARPIAIQPWGNLRVKTHQAQDLAWDDQAFPRTGSPELPFSNGTTLAFGLGRSYGDSCTNPDGNICLTRNLNRFEFFDPETGYLTCGAGTTLDEIMRGFVPRGWFPAVVPGTKFVTVGGAIANDIHGKNHHQAGNWGHHVTQIKLLRSDNPHPIRCSREENRELFRATIGGLGLTGIILSATIRLTRIESSNIQANYTPFQSLQEFASLTADAGETPHTVAWVDLTNPNGAGIFMAGRFEGGKERRLTAHSNKQVGMPCSLPGWAVNKQSIKAFNLLYPTTLLGLRRAATTKTTHYDPFFFPLDRIHHWNRAYGSRGFFQYQCVIPSFDPKPIQEILKLVAKSGLGSPLAVLKHFGNKENDGMLSFPKVGTTLAMDLTNEGWKTMELMNELDAVVRENQGRLYPAKDIRMSAVDFQSQYPQWVELEKLRDPALLSSFWKRVTQTPSRP